MTFFFKVDMLIFTIIIIIIIYLFFYFYCYYKLQLLLVKDVQEFYQQLNGDMTVDANTTKHYWKNDRTKFFRLWSWVQIPFTA